MTTAIDYLEVLSKANSIVGFVEAKDMGADLKTTLKTPQLKRHLVVPAKPLKPT